MREVEAVRLLQITVLVVREVEVLVELVIAAQV